MVKPPPIGPNFAKGQATEHREIRDWHTLVAKLANEAETLRSWTEHPPADELDSKIAGTVDKLATRLADDAARLAQAWPDGEDPPAHPETTALAEETAP